jgi:putative ABC transport system ATP-binding protein
MIELAGVDFHFDTGDFRLNVPALAVAPEERVAVIGPSGSGKTTLLHLIAGIHVPRSGRVIVDGSRVDALSDSARRAFRIKNIGFVFQDFELLDYLNVWDNILHPYRITNALEMTPATRREAMRLAGAMGLGDKLERSCADLSQGEKQRAAICRALLPGPRLILADEATGNLDPANKMRVLDLLFRCARAQGSTVLAVTHDHELLESFDRVVDFRLFSDGGRDAG